MGDCLETPGPIILGLDIDADQRQVDSVKSGLSQSTRESTRGKCLSPVERLLDTQPIPGGSKRIVIKVRL